MPFPFMAAGAAGLSFAGGLLANQGRGAEARKNRRFQRAEAGKQRVFQERMRNTEWQAGVADMQAAGINPALAYSQGGASAPMGASGSGAQADVEDVLRPTVSSAMDIKRLNQELKNMKKTGSLIDSQGDKADQDRLESQERERLLTAQYDGVVAQSKAYELALPGARNIRNFEAGSGGQATATFRALLRALQGR